jgi:hypothetical protein
MLLRQNSFLVQTETETRRFEWAKKACVRDEMSVSTYVKTKVTMADLQSRVTPKRTSVVPLDKKTDTKLTQASRKRNSNWHVHGRYVPC